MSKKKLIIYYILTFLRVLNPQHRSEQTASISKSRKIISRNLLLTICVVAFCRTVVQRCTLQFVETKINTMFTSLLRHVVLVFFNQHLINFIQVKELRLALASMSPFYFATSQPASIL